jgi:hypothetical protein
VQVEARGSNSKCEVRVLHYVNLTPEQSTIPIMEDFLTKLPGIVGFMPKLTWKSLEPEKNKYDFATLDAQLDWADAKGVSLIPMITDKSFGRADGTPGEDPAPAYARALPNQTGGYTVARWQAEVSEGFRNLHRVLTVRFWGELGGIAIQETAPGLTGLQLDTTEYTADKYVDHYRKLIKDCTGAPVYFHYNFIPQGQDRITDILSVNDQYGFQQLRLGGPDNIPASTTLQVRVYPHLYKYQGPKFTVMSRESYTQQGLSIEETLKFAKEALEVEEIFWTLAPSSIHTQIAPLIAKYA